MATRSGPVTDAIKLLDECSSGMVTDADLRSVESLLVSQLGQQVKRGNERAETSQLARLKAEVNAVVDHHVATVTTDPLFARFDVEREETRIILEVARQIRTRLTEQQQARIEVTTRWIAIAGVVIAFFVGIGQIVAAVIAK